jgi:hypothetical protein
MTDARPQLAVIASEGLPAYPIGKSDRASELSFIKWNPARWLYSRGHLSCTYEVQGVMRALFDIACLQSPLGTLPDVDDELAKLLRLDLGHWRALRRLGDLGPLRNWAPYDCDGEVRLGHPVLTAVLVDLMERREERDLRRTAQSEEKRIDRLRDALLRRGFSNEVLRDDILVRRIDEWLQETCRGNRTQAVYDRAILHAQRQGWLIKPR